MRRALIGLVSAALLATSAACTPDGEVPPDSKKPVQPAVLTFVAYGPPAVISAYTRIASDFTASHPRIIVNVRPYDTHAEAQAAVHRMRAKGQQVDLFLAERTDLDRLRKEKAIRRVDDLLGERQVDFGDGFARDALVAYSEDTALQCMPIDLSPMVVYYNSGLIDPAKTVTPGSNPVDPKNGWSMEEFTRAVRIASKHGRRGLYVEPSLEQVAPFLLSGGSGSLTDSTTDPTSLTMSDDSNLQAMQQLLEVIRNPRLTFNQKQLSRKSAIARFRSGDLGMMLGFRDLTPALRAQEGLPFDVMPMPVLSHRATVGESNAACVSSKTTHLAQTGDFLAYLVSARSMRRLAATGYIQPTNADVLNSPSFIQPQTRPFSAKVFAHQVRYIKRLPVSPEFTRVERRVRPDLRQLFYRPSIDPLEERLQAMDDESTQILAPEKVSPSPSSTPSD